jgi:hypothetical protein
MEEFIRRGGLPYEEAQAAFLGVDNLIELGEQRWRKDFGQHGFMHQTDHQAALRVILGREPTWLEVQDSWNQGGENIWLARRIQDTGPDPSWPPETLRLYNLINKWGPVRGQRIFAGKEPDPDAGTTGSGTTGSGTTGTGTTGTGTTGSGTTGSGTTGTGTTGTTGTATGLSPAPQRAEELATLIRPVYEKFAAAPPWFAQWMFPNWETLWPALKPLVVEAVLASRRAVERRKI